MAIFNNRDLFANPFGKTKSVSSNPNIQNPFGEQKIPNYMELFQFNDATKPIDFVELKDDKSSDKKNAGSTELTMEEDVSVKDRLSWEKILGVEWKRGKDTSVTQKDGEKIFESTVKNVVSGEERKIKTVIHKDKETCSTYMSVNGTPEGNPYSKLIQELKSMGKSEAAETSNSGAGAAQNQDGNANVTESETPGTPVNNAAPDAADMSDTGSKTNATPDADTTPTNQNVEKENKTPAQDSDSTAEAIKREEEVIEANGKKIHITYNALPYEVDENYDPGEGWFRIEKDGQKYLKHEASGLVFDLVKSKYGNGTTLELSTDYYKGSKETTETKVGANNETKEITTKYIGDEKIAYNTPDSDRYNPNYNPGEGWEKITYTSDKKKVAIWKNSENGLLFRAEKAQTEENNTTRTTFNWTASLYDETNLEKVLITNGNEAPDIGENYTKTHYVDKGDKLIVTYKNKHRPQNLLFTFKISKQPTISQSGTTVYQWDGNNPETRDLSDLYT